MQITFYNNSSDKIKLNKNITEVLSLSGTLRDECEILRPIIRIEHHGMINANYCYITEFHRYYFVKQYIERENLIRIECEVDPLMSYRVQINSLSVIVNNNTNRNNKYLNSDLWVSTVKKKTSIKQFPNGLNDEGEFILITAGG